LRKARPAGIARGEPYFLIRIIRRKQTLRTLRAKNGTQSDSLPRSYLYISSRSIWWPGGVASSPPVDPGFCYRRNRHQPVHPRSSSLGLAHFRSACRGRRSAPYVLDWRRVLNPRPDACEMGCSHRWPHRNSAHAGYRHRRWKTPGLEYDRRVCPGGGGFSGEHYGAGASIEIRES
jgi:hypothetical protein